MNANLQLSIFCVILSLLTAGWQNSASAQAAPTPTVSVTVVNPVIKVGETTQIQISVEGGKPENPLPISIPAEGLSINFLEEKRPFDSSTIINGQVTRVERYYYYYRVSGDKPGTYKIPPIPVSIGQQSLESPPAAIKIEARDKQIVPSGKRFAKLETAAPKIYVNQIFPITATVFVEGRNQLQGDDVVAADLEYESFVIKPFEPVNFFPADLQGKSYSTAVLPTTLFCLKAGRHQLGPVQFTVKVYEPRHPTLPFFKDQKPKMVNSDRLELEILPLPPGAPQSFTGGVGHFAMQSSASPLSIKVGDPITINFSVTGIGNLETMSAPVIPRHDRNLWKLYDAKKSILKTSDGIIPGKVEFTRVLIPLAITDQLPAFELSFFNPETEQYTTHTTKALSLNVIPDDTVEASPNLAANRTASQTAPLPDTSVPKPYYTDILHIRKNKPAWKKYSATSKPAVLLSITNVILSVLFIGILSLGILKRIRAKRQAKLIEETQLTYREACQKVKAGMERNEFFHNALEAFSIWEKEHSDSPVKLRELVRDMRRKCENALYSETGDHSENQIPTVEANEYLKVLKKLPVR